MSKVINDPLLLHLHVITNMFYVCRVAETTHLQIYSVARAFPVVRSLLMWGAKKGILNLSSDKCLFVEAFHASNAKLHILKQKMRHIHFV